jgi:predicted DNA-binding transcriptional regulator AlpA
MGNPFEISSIDNSELHAGRRPIEEHRLTSQLRKPPRRVLNVEPLLNAEDVAKRLNVSTDWVWDHSSRKKPLLPVIRMGDGALRYRASGIEEFIDERERLSALRRRA